MGRPYNHNGRESRGFQKDVILGVYIGNTSIFLVWSLEDTVLVTAAYIGTSVEADGYRMESLQVKNNLFFEEFTWSKNNPLCAELFQTRLLCVGLNEVRLLKGPCKTPKMAYF